jgi:hypothetical protein
MPEKFSIQITDNKKGTSIVVNTDGYLLLEMQGETIKATGNLEMKALAPILFKLAAEKFKG